MNTKHTSGPWKIWNSGYANCPNVIYFGPHAPRLNKDGLLSMPTAEGGTIAEVRTDESSCRPELEANARLIAAAPDLLETLHDLNRKLLELPSSPLVLDMAISVGAAIARAEGTGN